LRALLLYISKAAIFDPSRDIKEQELGAQVLGRRPGYDPQEDTIVRVQVRHLRERLEKYFATDGKDERLRLTIPKGGYVSHFEPHVDLPVTVAPAEPPPSVLARRARWLWPTAGVILAAFVLAAFILGRLSATWSGAAVPDEPAGNAALSRLFTRDKPTSLVIADSGVVLVQDLLRLDLSLDGYIAHTYGSAIGAVPEEGLRLALLRAADRQYTSLADATLASRFYAIGKHAGAKVDVRFARHLNVRDFNTGNFIMVGSRRGVPWVELFEPQMNFRMTTEAGALGFRNMQPLPGEPQAYWSTPSDGWTKSSNLPLQTFATVALLPNRTGSGTVLILNGATMEASEAAGEFILRPDFPRTIGLLMGADPARNSTYFEVLLKVSSVAGAPDSASVVSWRRKPKRF